MFNLIGTLVIAQAAGLSCATTGEPLGKSKLALDYGSTRYTFCCAGCPGAFQKDPAKTLKGDALKGKTVGEFLFDPTSGLRIDAKKAKASSDFNGVRYYFASTDAKAKFDAEPKSFTKPVTKEALYCPVMKHGLESVDKAGGYVDHSGIRYYVCCPNCLGETQKNIATMSADASKHAKPLAAVAPGKS